MSGLNRKSTQRSQDIQLTEEQKIENRKLIEKFKNEENEFEQRNTYLPKITNVPFYQVYNDTVMLVEKRKRNIAEDDRKKDPSSGIKRSASEGYNKNKNIGKINQHSLAPDAVVTFADEVAGRKGIRMRWIDMPEVKENNLARNLDKTFTELQEARFEIVTSEASYYKTLNMLVENFYFSHAMTPDVEEFPSEFRIKSFDKHHLFSNLLKLLCQVEKFLEALEAEFHDDPMLERIADIVFEYIQYNSKEYLTYIANQDYQSKTFEKLSKDVMFLEALKKLESNPDCGGLKLADQLNLPMQRILRYKLLMTAVLHRTPVDSPSYRNELICLGAIDNSITVSDRKLLKEGRLRILRLSKLDSSAFRRNFGHVLRKKAATATLLLFNDILLIAKHRQNDKILVEDICSLKSIRIERGQTPADAEITSYTTTPQISPQQDSSKDFSTVQSIVNNAIGEKKPERRTSLTRNVSLSKNFRWLSDANYDEYYLEDGDQPLEIYPFKLFIDVESGDSVEYEFQATSLSERERWIDALDKKMYPAYDEFILNTSDIDSPLMFCVKKPVSKQIDELEVNEGDTANLLVKCSDGWMKVQIGETRVGWVPTNCFEEVTNPKERQISIKDFILFNSAREEYKKYISANQGTFKLFKKTPAINRGFTAAATASVY